MARASALLAFLAAAALSLIPQSPAIAIHGRVIAADTDAPIRNARVGIDDDPTATVALTDADGGFVFASLPTGEHQLSASKTGFTRATIPASDGVEIKLTKAAAITGRVLDDRGEPMPLMNVVAMRRELKSGQLVFTRLVATETDELGEYRLFGLPAGEFVIATAPGRRETATASIPIDPERLVMRHFYGPADVPERARSVRLRAGDEVPGIDLTFPLPLFETLPPPICRDRRRSRRA